MRGQRLILLLIGTLLLLLVGMPYYGIYFQVRVVIHLLLTVALGGWLIVRIARGRFLPRTPLNWPLFAAAGVIALSVVFARDPRMAAEHAWWPLMHGLMFFFFAAQIQHGRQRLLFELLFFFGVVTVLLAGLNTLLWFSRVSQAVDWGAALAGRAEFPPVAPMITMPMHASTALAGFVTPQILVAFGWAATTKRRDERIALILLGVGLGGVLLATGSRGGLLSLAFGVVALVVLRVAPRVWAAVRGEQGWSRVLASAAAVVVIAVAAIGLVLYISRSGARSSGDEIRTSLWSTAVRAAGEHPLLGVGTGSFAQAIRDFHIPGALAEYRHRQAHNYILNTAAEEGIAGLAVAAWLCAALVYGWYRQRRSARGRRALRLEVVLAALAAVALQAQFDVFYTTPFVALVALLAAYAVTSPDQTPAPGRINKIAAWVALGLVAGYGVSWVFNHQAQALFDRSVWEEDRTLAQQAAELDPSLRLYDLQIAWLDGLAAWEDPTERPAAIAGLEAALAQEPTWETGWILLGGLYEQGGQIQPALDAMLRADAINPRSAAIWNWARIADANDAAPDDAIETAYTRAMSQNFWPFAPDWTETPRRQAALELLYENANPRLQYGLAEAFWPERQAGLVPSDPQTADDWWIVGQYALTVLDDPQAAWDAFDWAVTVNPNREMGEYYAARARAGAALGGERAAQAARDAAMAGFLYTELEGTPMPYEDDGQLAQAAFLRNSNFQLPDALVPPLPLRLLGTDLTVQY